MASTYSTNLKLELIGTGEQSGTWGTTTNTNLGTALEQAIVGYGNPNFASDADLTISLSDSNATQTARAFALRVTSGVSLTTTRNLIVPTIQKPYLIFNDTTGGQSIIVKTSAGTGVTVPHGARTLVYVDGTNVVSSVSNLPTLTLNSALAVASGGTGRTSLTANNVLLGNSTSAVNFVAPGSSGNVLASNGTTWTSAAPAAVNLASGVTGTLAVANGGTGVTSSTGSGSVVLSTSPTLTTPNIGTPSAGTLTNCTGLPFTGTTGTLAVDRGGTGVTTSTGSGSTVLSASPALTGTPTAPTAAFGTNTTQMATTAFVQAALAAMYPVGSIYTNATNATNPGTLLGFGTWTAFGAGRVMVGFNGSDPLFDSAEETGGSKDAIVVSHTHTATVTDPGHNHSYFRDAATGAGGGGFSGVDSETVTGTSTTGITVSNSTTGSSGTNANLQPYITVYMWKRTA